MILSLSNEKAGNDHVTPPSCLQEAAAGGDVDVRPTAGALCQRGELFTQDIAEKETSSLNT